MFTVPKGTTNFTIGKVPVHNLARMLETGGMTRADAVEGAFDHILWEAGGVIQRVGEVFLPEMDNNELHVAEAFCINTAVAV